MREKFYLTLLISILLYGISYAAPNLENAIKDLKSTAPSVRQAAVFQIGSSGDASAASHLTQVLYDKDPNVKVAVCWAISQLRPPNFARNLLPLLSDYEPEVRIGALSTLGTIGDMSIGESIVRLTYDPNIRVKKAAIDSLGQLRYAPAGPRLSALISDPNPEIRAACALAMKNMSFTPPPSVVGTGLTDSDSRVRAVSAEGMGTNPPSSLSPQLIAALKDPSAEVRKNAATSLGRTSNPQAIKPLINALHDPSQDVSSSAGIALGMLGSAAIEPLKAEFYSASDNIKLNIIKAYSMMGESGATELIPLTKYGEIRESVILALGDTKASGAIPSVINALNDGDEKIRNTAVASLGKIGTQAVVKLKAAASSSKLNVRKGIAKALGLIPGQESIALLVNLLADEEESIVGLASVSLGRMGEAARPALMKALNSDDDMQRAGAINALSLMGDRSLPALTNALYDKSAKVRAGAALGIGQMDGKSAIEQMVNLMQRDSDTEVKRACAWSIGRIGDASLIDMLVMEKTRAAGKNQPDLQLTIEKAIEAIERKTL